MQDQLDPQVLSLAKSIRKAETGTSTDPYNARGASGESGAYQFMPDTWNALSQKHLGQAGAPMTVENQNKVAYGQIKEWKDKGYNPAQIASLWNSGNPDAYKQGLKGTNAKGVAYDVPAYVAKVSQYYKEMAPPPSSSQQTPGLPDASKPEGYQPWFKASPTDTGAEAGLKAAGNLIPSALHFGKSLVDMVNPINAIKNISQIPEAWREAKAANEGSGALASARAIEALPGEAIKAAVPQTLQQLAKGDLSGAAQTITEDPFGQVAPVVLAAQGVAGKMGYGDQFGKAVEMGASPITKPVGAILGKAGELGGGVGLSTISHLTGMDSSTIKQILTNPSEFSKLKQEAVSRGDLAKEVKTAIDTRLNDLSETGSGYDSFKKSGTTAEVPPDFVKSTLEENGFKIKKGKIVADSNSLTRNPSDIRALQKFYDDWGKKKTLTSNEFFNMRKDLGDLAKYDKITGSGKTGASESISKSLYSKADIQIRDTQFKDLQQLDEIYSPERDFLNQVKRDYFDENGNLKDNAPSKIMNATNKEQLLGRLEDLMPGITKRIELLKAVEDIQRASGVKVGNYGRLTAAGLGYATSGILGALAAEIISSPSVAVPLLRQAGYLGSGATPIINTLRLVAGDINGKSGGLLTPFTHRETKSF